jgi:hypothetical protein
LKCVVVLIKSTKKFHSMILYLLLCAAYSTHYVFPTVSFVCQTSTMVAAVPAISYYYAYMWHCRVSLVYYVSVLICVWNTDSCFYFTLGIHFDIRQHHSIYDKVHNLYLLHIKYIFANSLVYLNQLSVILSSRAVTC